MSARPPFELDPVRVFALAAWVALVRAAMAEVSDGFALQGLWSLAATAASARFVSGFVLALVVLLALRAWHRARPRAWLPVILCAAFVYLFTSMRVPALPVQAPGFEGPVAIIGHALALAVALAVARLLVRAERFPRRLDRVLVRGGLVLLAASLVMRLVDRVVHRATPERPHVIVVVLGGVRGDRLGCAGWSRPTTPNLDAFARGAVRFENAYSPTPFTLASHATLLTGLFPSEHHVGPRTALPARAPSLARDLRETGLDTFALVDATPWLHERYGLARDFDWWRSVAGGADEKLSALAPVLDVAASRRAFVYVHFDDANADTRRMPYDADRDDVLACVPAYAGEFVGCDERGRCGAEWLLARSMAQAGIDGAAPEVLDAKVIEHVSARYDAGLRSLDRRLGRFFDDLEQRGMLESALVIVTGDHGQAFFEHGRFLHLDAHRECTHVPLLVRPPGGTAERSIRPAVSTADVAPTVLEWIGAQHARPTAISLAGVVRGAAAGALPDRARVDAGPAGGGVRSARMTLLEQGGRLRLYDLRLDPREERPLDPREDPRTAELWRARMRPGEPFGPGMPLEPLDETTRRVLEQAGEPDPTADALR